LIAEAHRPADKEVTGIARVRGDIANDRLIGDVDAPIFRIAQRLITGERLDASRSLTAPLAVISAGAHGVAEKSPVFAAAIGRRISRAGLVGLLHISVFDAVEERAMDRRIGLIHAPGSLAAPLSAILAGAGRLALEDITLIAGIICRVTRRGLIGLTHRAIRRSLERDTFGIARDANPFVAPFTGCTITDACAFFVSHIIAAGDEDQRTNKNQVSTHRSPSWTRPDRKINRPSDVSMRTTPTRNKSELPPFTGSFWQFLSHKTILTRNKLD